MTLILICILLSVGGGITIIVDPLFHYHAPLKKAAYQFNAGQRYVNDGITLHWDYNAIITGTSMTENFKTSEMDEIFDVKSVKISYSGGSFYEIGENLKKSFASHKHIKMVIRSLDTGRIGLSADYLEPNFNYPTYLTDVNIFNDTYYIFNKTLLIEDTLETILATAAGSKRKSFDDFGSWDSTSVYGEEAVLSQYSRQSFKKKMRKLTDEEYENIYENMMKNVISIVADNPETEFYFFFPPASIVGMDSYNNIGELEAVFETQQYAYELLLPYENVKVFGWLDEYEVVCDLNNYKDPWHYTGEVNSKMLRWMNEDYGLLTKENYKNYFEKCKTFYENYNYSELFMPS